MKTFSIETNDIYKVLCHADEGSSSFSIQSQDEFLSGNFLDLGNSVFTRILMNPKIMTTDDALRKYSPKMLFKIILSTQFKRLNLTIFRRNCYFSDEGSLKYFTKYSLTSCLQECRSKIILESCGCIPITSIRKFFKLFCTINLILTIKVEKTTRFVTTKT